MEERLLSLIEKCTKGRKRKNKSDALITDIDEASMNEIKTICKTNSHLIPRASYMLNNQLKSNSYQTRYFALVLFNMLFTRSRDFRLLQTSSFNEIIDHVILHKASTTNKKSKEEYVSEFKQLLIQKGLDYIEGWESKYSLEFPEIAISYRYIFIFSNGYLDESLSGVGWKRLC